LLFPPPPPATTTTTTITTTTTNNNLRRRRKNARLVTVVCRNILIVSPFLCEGGLLFSCTSDEAVIFQNRITGSKDIFASGIF